MFWVTMTDKALSNWGGAKRKTSKLVFECESIQDAEIVADNARSRSEMRYVNICTTEPHYNSNYQVTYRHKGDGRSSRWYQPSYFRSQQWQGE